MRLHLYVDMDVEKQARFWSKQIGIPIRQFRKPYIKETGAVKRVNYRGRFGYGTCNVILYNRDVSEYVAMGVKRIREIYAERP